MAKVSAEKLTSDFVSKVIKEVGLRADLSVEEKDNAVAVSINGDNLGALIGFHGETLESLQLLTSLYVNKKLGEDDWKRITLDIGNWRAERLGVLENMVERAVADLIEQKLEKVTLPSMSASQRREVHVVVSEKFSDYETQSEGEEPNRRVVLIKK